MKTIKSDWLIILFLSFVFTQASFAVENNQQQFIGSKSCKACHQQQFNDWRGSHHDRAMQHATKKSVLGDFKNSNFKYNGITSTFFRKSNKFFVRTDGPDGKLADYEIKYTFGVEPLQQYLIEMAGGRVQALGIAWDNRTKQQGGQRWYHLYPDQKLTFNDRLHWTKADQNWNYMCAGCHSTNLQKKYNSNKNIYSTSWSEINVACEACHGPASKHVAMYESVLTKKFNNTAIDQKTKGLSFLLDERSNVTWQLDPKTGNARRSRQRQTNKEIEMCASCHSRRSVISKEYAFNKTLHDNYLPALLTEFLYHPDGQIKEEDYVYGSFVQSKMYHQGVTCSDCHEPHSLKLRAKGNGVCLQCHQKKKYDQAKHHFHKQGSRGALCAECHMPQTVYMGIDGRHDHSIRIPRPDLSLSLNTPNACNQCHANKDAQWANKKMQTWYGADWPPGWHFGETLFAARTGAVGIGQDLAALAASPKQPVIARATAVNLLQNHPGPLTSVVTKSLLKDKNAMIRVAALQTLDTMTVEFRLKEGFALLRDPVLAVRIEAARVLAVVPRSMMSMQQLSSFDMAIKEYQTAQQANADRPESYINLGLLAIRLQQFKEAEKFYRQALKIYPGFINVYVNLADLYRSQKKENKAERILKQAIDLAKNNADVHYALGLLYVRKKQMKPALHELKTAWKLQKNNVRYGYVYAVALNSDGQTTRSIYVLKKIHESHPVDIDTLSALISFYQSSGKRKKALTYALKLQKLIPDNPQIGELISSLENANH